MGTAKVTFEEFKQNISKYTPFKNNPLCSI